MKVLIVGSAEQSAGGVASVIRTMKKMPVWEECSCYWLGTQIQRNYLWKLWYALKAYCIALCIIWKYDIVHFHTVPDRIGLIIQMPVLLLAIICRKKIIMHIHMGNQLRRHTDNGLFKWCLRRADIIVLLAKRWEKLFKEVFVDVNVPTTVIYNACETNADVDFAAKEKSIIMAAYFNDNKAPDILLKAWKKIKEKYLDWHVTMMGNGEVERFRKMSEEMGLQESVTFTGYITGKKKDDAFRKASIYCMCSYEEGFPVVVLEAWANGICVVTTPVGGLPDVIEEGKNCLTFPFGDAESLAKQLCRLIESKDLRKNIADYSHSFVCREFSIGEVSNSIKALYTRIKQE